MLDIKKFIVISSFSSPDIYQVSDGETVELLGTAKETFSYGDEECIFTDHRGMETKIPTYVFFQIPILANVLNMSKKNLFGEINIHELKKEGNNVTLFG
jgi:hypothetical protein